MLFLSLIACEEPEKEPVEEEETAPPLVMNVTSNPTEIDFGTVALGEPTTQVVMVYNQGTANAVLTSALADSDDLSIEAPTGLALAPGASAEVTVTWTPPTPSTLSDTLEILLVGSELRQLQIPVSGIAAGPVMSLSVSEANFGTVTVGCTGEIPVTISNVGSSDLVVDTVTLDGTDTITMSSSAGELTPAPWTIPGGASQDFLLDFTPVDERTVSTRLHIGTNDPVTPTVDLDVYGKGYIEAQNSISYDVIREQNITMLFALNEVAAFDDRFEDALPTLFDTLQATGAEYRVAFVVATNGSVNGDVSYIDNTYTTTDAVAVALEMVSTAMGDNDYLLQTFEAAIPAHREWLLDENDDWADSKLSLIASNSDVEQSSGDYMTYLLDYWTYKEDPANIAVSAITGDVPRGCNSSGYFAEPAQLLYEAANNSGGLFCTWCATEWSTYMEQIVATGMGDQQVFALDGTPAEWTIEVFVDNLAQTTGWAYDASQNAVVFEEDSYPGVGSEVRIDYIYVAECP